MTFIHAVVLDLLARHLGREVATLSPGMRLERDLDLTPLELVLLALEVEELEGVEARPEDLASTETVGELLAVFARSAANGRRQEPVSRVA
jgi:acyl carrier protein